MPDTPAATTRWSDLLPRVLSGIVLAVVGIADVWVGGIAFDLLVALVVGLISWEIARMCAPGRDRLWIVLGASAGLALLAAGVVTAPVAALAGLVAVALLAALVSGAQSDRVRIGVYLAWILVAGWGFVQLRETGLAWVFWLIAVVVATDIAGYFAGRIIGGPKFWPRVSPKKTWSGTAAGWIAAAIVGALFAGALGPAVIWLSALLSFASQMGDAAESALKRAKGVKDASQLIPGHGGVFDRFDAMMGAALVVTLAGFAGFGGAT